MYLKVEIELLHTEELTALNMFLAKVDERREARAMEWKFEAEAADAATIAALPIMAEGKFAEMLTSVKEAAAHAAVIDEPAPAPAPLPVAEELYPEGAEIDDATLSNLVRGFVAARGYVATLEVLQAHGAKRATEVPQASRRALAKALNCGCGGAK